MIIIELTVFGLVVSVFLTTFGDRQKYSLHRAETESVQNVERLLSAETVRMSTESAPFSTFLLKPKFDRPSDSIPNTRIIQILFILCFCTSYVEVSLHQQICIYYDNIVML